MHINKEAIEEIRRSHDLVQTIRSRGVELKRKGRHYVGLCPFHEDHSPSLTVSPEKQLWNCLGACAAGGGKSGGDVITFVARLDGVSFPEALRRLGYEEPSRKGPRGLCSGVSATDVRWPRSEAASVEQGPLTNPTAPVRRDLLLRVTKHYHRVFKEHPVGQEYLRKRGLTDPEMLAAFQVGYADGSLLRMTDPETTRVLRETGLVTAKGRELLAECVVIPLILPELGVVGLYGRHVKRDQHLYLRGPLRGVFHWQAMKGSKELILTESVIDALTLYQAGFRNVSAIHGTQGFTADHEELLRRFRVRRVLLCLDNDEAGSRATHAISEKLRQLGIEAMDARARGAKDPSELVAKLGVDAAKETFRKVLNEARNRVGAGAARIGAPEKATPPPGPPSLTVDERAGETADTTPEPEAGAPPPPRRHHGVLVEREQGGGWRVRFGDRSYRVRGLVPDGMDRLRVNLRVDASDKMHVETVDLYSQRGRSIWQREASRILGVEEAELTREVGDLVEILEDLRLDLRNAKEKSAVKVEIADAAREEALKRLRSLSLLEDVLVDFERVGFVGEKPSLTVTYLASLSRLLDEPLGILIVSRSAAGKSSLQDAVCSFVPEESLAKHTRITGQALFYGEEDSLVNKVLSIDEEKGAADASYAVRILQSEQQLSIVTTETDPQSGRHKAHTHEVRGPVAILLTTASPEALDYETRNRFVQVSIDESAEQTRRILERQRQMDTLDGLLGRKEADAIRQRQQTMQRLLRPIGVVNPYAPQLRYPDRQLQMRREHKKYLTLIKTIALLHQHQREVKRARRGDVELEYIEVLPSDIEFANRLARAVLGHGLDELAPPARALLREIARMVVQDGQEFTRRDVKTATGWSDWSVREYLRHLIDLEYVVQAGGGNGRRISYELIFDGDPDEDQRYLAGLVDVNELVHRQKALSVGSN
jgi:5S rRNA maturation endonuclease (ribonuclease M5)